jgi:hypothetical protein
MALGFEVLQTVEHQCHTQLQRVLRGRSHAICICRRLLYRRR